MNPRIRKIDIRNQRLDPMDAEIRIGVDVDDPALELSGRLTGPRCTYATTLPETYPVREVCRVGSWIEMRALIPEPALWDPESPFLYDLRLKSADGSLDEKITVGLRSMRLSPRGLLWNGRLAWLRGCSALPDSQEALRRLREAGCNGLLVPVAPEHAPWWDIADQLGFFIVAALQSARHLTLAQDFARHACHLATFQPADIWQPPFGVEATNGFASKGAPFLVVPKGPTSALQHNDDPKILMVPSSADGEACRSMPGCFGWIAEAWDVGT